MFATYEFQVEALFMLSGYQTSSLKLFTFILNVIIKDVHFTSIANVKIDQCCKIIERIMLGQIHTFTHF